MPSTPYSCADEGDTVTHLWLDHGVWDELETMAKLHKQNSHKDSVNMSWSS